MLRLPRGTHEVLVCIVFHCPPWSRTTTKIWREERIGGWKVRRYRKPGKKRISKEYRTTKISSELKSEINLFLKIVGTRFSIHIGIVKTTPWQTDNVQKSPPHPFDKISLFNSVVNFFTLRSSLLGPHNCIDLFRRR